MIDARSEIMVFTDGMVVMDGYSGGVLFFFFFCLSVCPFLCSNVFFFSAFLFHSPFLSN